MLGLRRGMARRGRLIGIWMLSLLMLGSEEGMALRPVVLVC
jgi:hypothetical protein